MTRYDSLFEGDSPDEILKNIAGMGVKIAPVADPLKPKRRKLSKNIATQIDMEEETRAEESVKNWLFREAPEIKQPPVLKIEESSSFAQYTDKKEPNTIDDGSFVDDPVLKALRNKLYQISNFVN